jgi:hypothetical protein
MSTTPYRAACWRSADGQATARLTSRDQADLPLRELLALATAEARANELDVDGGLISIEQLKE